jgi:hypothetical protein
MADNLYQWSNRLLLIHTIARGGLASSGRFESGYLRDPKASAELEAIQRDKAALVREFCDYIREGEELATPREFLRRFVEMLKRHGHIDTTALERFRKLAMTADAKLPFPPSYASIT